MRHLLYYCLQAFFLHAPRSLKVKKPGIKDTIKTAKDSINDTIPKKIFHKRKLSEQVLKTAKVYTSFHEAFEEPDRVHKLHIQFPEQTSATFSEALTRVGELQNLQYLKFSGKISGMLPDSIYILPNIEYLDLSENPKLNFDSIFVKLKVFTKIKAINLYDNRLKRIPSGITRLKSLERLNLSQNPDIFLKDCFNKLQNLKRLRYLDLSYNISQYVPDNISRLRSLEYLDLRYNWLAEIPEGLGKLINLRTLILRGNQISVLPESMGNLNELAILDLGDNSFSDLKLSTDSLQKLEKFLIDGNQKLSINSVISMLNGLPKLHYLDISNNWLDGIPGNIDDLQQLDTLIVRYNSIKSVGNSVPKLAKLKYLDLSKNSFKKNEFESIKKRLEGVKVIFDYYKKEEVKGF